MTILSAVRGQGLSAAVAWYGFPPAEAATLAWLRTAAFLGTHLA